MIDLIKNPDQQYRTDLPYFDYHHEILDVNLLTKNKKDIQLLRGPLPSRKDLDSGNYFVTIGSAHTFGRFSNKPYGQYISEQINVPCLNAGVSDACPSLFCRPEWLKYINNAKFAIIQIMSARTGDNHVFYGGGVATRKDSGASKRITKMLSLILQRKGGEFVKKLLKQSRNDYVKQYLELKKQIKIPIIHLWHSVRRPEAIENLNDTNISTEKDIIRWVNSNYTNQFPHLINQNVINQITAGEIYLEYVSSDGLPKLFYDKNENIIFHEVKSHTGKILKEWPCNNYYPPQCQHEEVSQLLIPLINRLTT